MNWRFIIQTLEFQSTKQAEWPFRMIQIFGRIPHERLLDSPGQVVVFGPPLKDSSSDSDSESDTSSSSDESASSESSSEEAVDPASWLAKVVEVGAFPGEKDAFK